ncbi:MAG TPA: hypothetical protein VN815_00790 [Steroidobacteraceae bacterium]|nr:hypothetical protein [Steroidobacteraceae bacterium]
MALSVETVNRLLASGRNYVSTIVGFVGGIGLMSAAQQKGVSEALTEIFNGLSQIVHGATSLWGILIVAFPAIGLWMGRIASNSAKVTSQTAAVKAAVADPNTPIPPEAKTAIVDAAKEVQK